MVEQPAQLPACREPEVNPLAWLLGGFKDLNYGSPYWTRLELLRLKVPGGRTDSIRLFALT